MKQRAFFGFFFIPQDLFDGGGGGGGAEGLGWDLPEVLSPIGCQDKFHHIVKKKRHWLCAYCAPMFVFSVVF